MSTAFDPASRRTGIFGTDIAAIVGLSKWKTALDVYMDKLGLRERPEQTGAMGWGLKLEGLVLQEYCRTTSRVVIVPEPRVMTHPKRSWMRGSPDGLAADRSCGVEIKTSKWGFDFGDEGSDDVPDEYVCQVQWYAEITGIQKWDLAALIGGSDFRIYHLEHDPEFCGLLVEAAEKFMRDNVAQQVPPPLDGSDSAMTYLQRRYGRHDDRLLTATAQVDSLVRKMRVHQLSRDQAEQEYEKCKQQVCAIISDAAGIEGPDWKVTWKSTKPSKRVDYERLARNIHLAYALLSETTKQPGRTFDDFVVECSETKPGFRRFLAKFKEEK